LFHELAHAIFDVESAIAALDFSNRASQSNVEEQRADAFAQEALVPSEVLRHVGQRHAIRWNMLDAGSIATMVAGTHVEQRFLAKALVDAGLIASDQSERVEGVCFSGGVRKLFPHY